MTLKDKINVDLKDAMKSGDKVRLTAIRSLRALILEIEKSAADAEVSPEDEIQLLSTSVKKRKDSIEQFRNAGRDDLVAKEEAELAVIQGYLPKQLTREEIVEKVRGFANELDAKTKADFGKLMQHSAKNLKGLAEGRVIKEVVEETLS